MDTECNTKTNHDSDTDEEEAKEDMNKIQRRKCRYFEWGFCKFNQPVRPGRRKYRSVNNNNKTFLPIFFVKQTDRQTDRQALLLKYLRYLKK